MKKIRNALIMAAGRGLRMSPLTDTIPKPMAPFLGSTLIAEGISKLKPFIENIHITVGYKGAMLAQHVIKNGASTIFNTEGKGNAWWVYNTLLSKLDEPCYVLTADNVIELDFDQIESDYKKLGSPACMLVPVKPVQGVEGDYLYSDKQGRVLELSREKPSEKYCSGIQVINPAKINALTTHSENFMDLWNQLILIEQLYCSNVYPDKWYSVDTITQLNEIEKIIANHHF